MAEEESNQKDKNTNALSDESLEATLDRSKNQVVLKDLKTGRITTLKANIIETEDDSEDNDGDEIKPLSADEFRQALEQLAALGLTFTADRMPRVIAKDPKSEEGFFSDEFGRLQAAYPNLPREVSTVVYHALTGAPAPETVVGTKEELEKKVRAVRDLVVTANYRSEFFFKRATKLPYFEDIDWEVVFKTHERNVQEFPAVAYALLSLLFHNSSALDEHQNTTVAVDLKLVNKLIRILVDVKTALEDAQQFTNAISEASKLKDKDDATRNQT
jgi:hypothetical protein